MLNTEELRKDTKDSINGILWFFALIPLAMAMHWFAKYFNMIGFTIMGWFIATLGAIQLGFGIARGGKRLFRVPLRNKSVTN